jgi:hypothetical protein
MAYEHISERVGAGFSTEASRQFGDMYLDILVANMRDLLTAFRRTVLLVVVTIVAFLLLRDAETVPFTLGPFTLTDVSPVTALLPGVAAHLLYEATTYFYAIHRYVSLHRALVGALHPTLTEHDLELGIIPAMVSFLGGVPWREMRAAPPGRAAELHNLLEALLVFVLFLGGLVFLIYAVVKVMGSPAPTVARWASATFTGFTVWRIALLVLDEWPALQKDN